MVSIPPLCLSIGQTVTNFGQKATVIGFHPITGDPILRDAAGVKWLADATKCTPVETTAVRHKDGLVVFL